MDGALGSGQLDDGWRALDDAQWDTARAAFTASLDEEETPDALEGLGLAVWFLGDVKAGVALREQAFEGYAQARRCDDAARIAV